MTQQDTARGSTLTIKFDAGYAAPWFVGNGTPEEIREQVLSVFGFDRDLVAEYTLAQLAVEATRTANGLYTAQERLGAVIVGTGEADGVSGAQPAATPPPARKTGPTGNAAWASIEGQDSSPAERAAAPEPEADPLVAAINAANSKGEFALIWKANKDRFTEPEVKAAAAAAQQRFAA